MLAIQINDPELEAFYREEYENDATSLAQQFTSFLREKAIKRDVQIALEESENDDVMSAEEAFEQIIHRIRHAS
jgi:hypothetical protein